MRAAFLVTLLLLASIASVDATHVEPGKIRSACGGGPYACGIDPVGGEDVESVGEPTFAKQWPGNGLPGDARVLGIVVGDDVRAYPVRMLNHYEIVNDVIDGQNVAVTFCPLCGSGVTFIRDVTWDSELRETDFSASGFLYRTDMVMWDPVTNQLWNQITGATIGSVDGGSDNSPSVSHVDMQLDFLPTTVTTWSNWKAQHPDTTVLQPIRSPGSYRENMYSVTDAQNCDHGFSGERGCDVNGLHPKVQVVGYNDKAGGIAFPILDVAQNGGAAFYVTDEGRGFVGVGDIHGDSAIYDAAGHTFTADESGLWMDETGGLWDLTEGVRLDRPGQLQQVNTTHQFWFAWSDHYPDTEVWLPPTGATIPPPDGRGIPGPGAILVGLLLLGIAASTRKQL